MSNSKNESNRIYIDIFEIERQRKEAIKQLKCDIKKLTESLEKIEEFY